jgi:hypothetical protein
MNCFFRILLVGFWVSLVSCQDELRRPPLAQLSDSGNSAETPIGPISLLATSSSLFRSEANLSATFYKNQAHGFELRLPNSNAWATSEAMGKFSQDDLERKMQGRYGSYIKSFKIPVTFIHRQTMEATLDKMTIIAVLVLEVTEERPVEDFMIHQITHPASISYFADERHKTGVVSSKDTQQYMVYRFIKGSSDMVFIIVGGLPIAASAEIKKQVREILNSFVQTQ